METKGKNKIRLMRRVCLITLALVVFFSAVIFADWPLYQGNDKHNGRITGATPLTTQAGTGVTLVTGNPGQGQVAGHLDVISFNAAGWSGIDIEPLMQTVDGTTYAYVVRNGGTVSGGSGGIRLEKVECSASTSHTVWSKRLATTSGYHLSTPVLVQGSNANSEADDAMYVAVSGSTQVLSDPALDTLPGTSVWTHSGTGTAASGSVTLGVNENYTLTQSGFQLAGVNTNRVAMGIYVGNSSVTNSYVSVAYSVNGSTAQTVNFTPSDLIRKDGTNRYYYYLNLDIGSVTPQSGNTITYTVTMTSGNSGDTVAVEYAELYQHTGGLMKVTGLQAGLNQDSLVNVTSLTGAASISGQFNTPLTYYSKIVNGSPVEYLYFGTYSGSQSYYEYNITTGTITPFAPPNGNFYWAGAIVVTVGSGSSAKDYVVFGSDTYSSGGTKYAKLYYREVGSFGSSGGDYNLNTIGAGVTDAGNIRSSISRDDSYLYFTSQGTSSASYIWKFPISSIGTPTPSGVSAVALSGTSSTSTPAISSSGKIYVGYYNGFNAGGVDVINSGFTTATSICNPGPVQSSVIVYHSAPYDYLYFTTNSSTGCGYCYRYKTTLPVQTTKIWETAQGTYTLQGMASSGTYLTFGNDGNNFYIVH